MSTLTSMRAVTTPGSSLLTKPCACGQGVYQSNRFSRGWWHAVAGGCQVQGLYGRDWLWPRTQQVGGTVTQIVPHNSLPLLQLLLLPAQPIRGAEGQRKRSDHLTSAFCMCPSQTMACPDTMSSLASWSSRSASGRGGCCGVEEAAAAIPSTGEVLAAAAGAAAMPRSVGTEHDGVAICAAAGIAAVWAGPRARHSLAVSALARPDSPRSAEIRAVRSLRSARADVLSWPGLKRYRQANSSLESACLRSC